MEKYYVYIIKSEKDDSFYIGQTNNIERRLSEHNEGLSSYTSSKLPWHLHYLEELNTREEAMKREVFLKKQRNKTFYEKIKNK